MDITPDNVRALQTTFNGSFRKGYSSAALYWSLIATAVPSTSRSNTYAWMQSLGPMREWIGERQFNNLVAQSYVIENKTFEKSVEVLRDDIEDDNLGTYGPMFEELGRVSAKNPDILLAKLLKTGHLTPCHDGQYFFDTDHPVNPKKPSMGVQSNAFTSCALNPANFELVRSKMMSFVDEGGQSLAVSPMVLVVPPALEAAAERIVKAAKDASGADNVNYGKAKIIVIHELAGQDTTWYLFDTSRAIKPFIVQLRRSSKLTRKDNAQDETMFIENKAKYGTDQRENVGFGLFFLAAKATAEASFP
jgi:phage major head subunit gpT-like protein